MLAPGVKPMRHKIRFRLGREAREIADIDPTMTVLDYLRLVERRCGTKEGCAEGDCGACTVVLARPEGEGLRYEAVNSCIQFVPTLDGCQLITVEDLKDADGALHPVQQALVDTHGSQCGFCTPGFVMSLFALYRNEAGADRARIDDVLAGNLCRCTGYAPIVEAAKRMYAIGDRAADPFAREEGRTAAALRELDDGETLSVGRDGRRCFAPTTLDGLAELLVRHPDACVLAGGTDVGLWVTKEQRVLETVIYLGRVAELSRLAETPAAIEIGAGVSYSDAMAAIARHYPDFGEVIRRLGSVQIRNAGTLGGNVANGSPIGDSPPALIAAGATLHLRRGADRRAMPIEDFFLDYGKQDRRPGEFVEKIVLPKPAPGARFRNYKISKRFDQDISAVCGAYSLRLEDGGVAEVRIAYGGMAAVPRRAFACEGALAGRPWTRTTVESGMAALAEDFAPITDWRASREYRTRVAANLLLKLYVETSDEAGETRLVGDRGLAHA